MQRKVFIGIDLDKHVKNMLVKSVRKWHNLPIKWHKEESLHIALIPIGWVNEDDVFDISDALENATDEMNTFAINFDKILTISKNNSDDVKDAQLVRLEGDDSEELRILFEKLESELGLPVVQKKNFKPLVTLGRMRAKKWQELEEYPNIDIDFPVMMDVFHITLFESVQIEDKWQIEPVRVFELNSISTEDSA